MQKALALLVLCLPQAAAAVTLDQPGGEVSFGLGNTIASSASLDGGSDYQAAAPSQREHSAIPFLGIGRKTPSAGNCVVSLVPKFEIFCALSK